MKALKASQVQFELELEQHTFDRSEAQALMEDHAEHQVLETELVMVWRRGKGKGSGPGGEQQPAQQLAQQSRRVGAGGPLSDLL